MRTAISAVPENSPQQAQLQLIDQLLYNGPRTNDSAYDWRDIMDNLDNLMRDIQEFMEVRCTFSISLLCQFSFVIKGLRKAGDKKTFSFCSASNSTSGKVI